MPLREDIEKLSARAGGDFSSEDRALFDEFKIALNRGEVRAAERSGSRHALSTGHLRVQAYI